jgi:hypothetical protein
MNRLTDQELATVRGLVQEFNGLKMQLADAYMHQQTVAKRIEEVRISYAQMEQALIETYGNDCSINIDTGEITPKDPIAAAPATMQVVK